MTPSVRQRLGLAAAQLDPHARRLLFAARVGSFLFAVEGLLVLVGAAIGGGAAGDARIFLGTGGAFCLALVFLFAYERLQALGGNLIALAGTASITLLVAGPGLGFTYRILYVWPALYVAFFLPRRQAAGQVAAIVLASGAALAATLPTAQATELWLLSTVIIVGATVFTSSLRDHFSQLVQKAQQHSATLDAFFQHAPAGFGVLDRDLRHERVNQALAEIMGHERHEIEGHTLRELAPMNANVLEPLARSVLESGEPVLGIEVQNSDGKTHLVSYYPVPGLRGIVGVGTAVTDVTHLKTVESSLEDTNRRLTVLATTDELTQLPNRRMFSEQLDLALARARRSGLAVAVLCLDLDRFKEVNDTLGHAYGDRTLVEFATLLRAGARDTDVVARVGGDEFLILLADLDVQEAPELAETVVERIRHLLSDPIPVDAVEIRADASIGVAIYPTDSRDADGLLAAADAAMYVGKNALTRVA